MNKTAYILFLTVLYSFAVSSSYGKEVLTVPTTIKIKSEPTGALVLFSNAEKFDTNTAINLGETNMFRNVQMPEEGGTIKIFKRGFHEYETIMTPQNAKIKALLTPYSEEKNQKTRYRESSFKDDITLIPMRVGTRRAKGGTIELDQTKEAEKFRSQFITTFINQLSERCENSSLIKLEEIEKLENVEFWREIESELNNIRVDMIEYYPVPMRIDLSQDFLNSISHIDGKILLLRAEALYLTGAERFFKAATPMIIAGASSAIGQNNPLMVDGNTGVYFVTVVDTSYTTKNTIIVQMLLVDSKTKEILWFGQIDNPDKYEREGVTTKTAELCSKQIPKKFLN